MKINRLAKTPKLLAQLTENYVSGDIELLVNEASRTALNEKSRITMNTLKKIIAVTNPTISLQELQKYEMVRAKMEGKALQPNNERPRIGFN